MNLCVIRFLDKYFGGFIIFLLSFFKKTFNRNITEASFESKNILVIKLWGLGNLALLSPSLFELKDKYPTARISLLTLDLNKGFSSIHPLIDSCYYISNVSYFLTLKQVLFFIAKNWKKFDLVLDFEQFAKVTSIITFLICPDYSVGFNNPSTNRDLLYSVSIPYIDHSHMVKSFARILKPLGIKLGDTFKYGMEFFDSVPFSEIKDRFFSNVDFKKDFVVVIHAGSSENFKRRRWSQVNFLELINSLIHDFEAKIILTGNKADKEVNDFLERNVKSDAMVNSTMVLNIKDLLQVIKTSTLVITNDTAPVHFASMFNIPTIAFFGPNTPFLYGSLSSQSLNLSNNIFCSPCINNYNYKVTNCQDPVCMKELTFQRVYPDVKAFIKKIAKRC